MKWAGRCATIWTGSGTPFRQSPENSTGPRQVLSIGWFHGDLLPGYARSFPQPGNRVKLGFGCLRDGERRVQDMKDLWNDLLRRAHVVEALGEGE